MSRCKICRSEFVRRSMTHKCCGPDCAAEYAKRERMKAELKELRKRKLAIKTRSQWLKEAQASFNCFIRTRDAGKPCICCDRPLGAGEVGGKFDCGHYRSIGSAPHLRFDERNANGQNKQCNRWRAGRAVDYRLGLIKRIGFAEVEALEADQTVRKFTIPELIQIKAEYKAKTKALRAEQERKAA